MLADAGVDHLAVRPEVDESAAKCAARDAVEIASDLARLKALSVSRSRPGDWVIGSDSIVSIEGRTFDKPRSREEAAEHLRLFSGKSMILTSAVALAIDETIDWSHVEHARLGVRAFSEEFIRRYLDSEWPEVGNCVGVFRMEGAGVQLFDKVDGNHFTILGMPLVPLLAALRARGILQS